MNVLPFIHPRLLFYQPHIDQNDSTNSEKKTTETL